MAEVVDPVPPGGGMLNGNTKIGLDNRQRPIISYHKFDTRGKTQLYNARRDTDGWRIYQTSNWDYRWEFSGGAIRGEISFAAIVVESDGSLNQTYSHPKSGSGTWRLDPQTLEPVRKAPRRPGLPSRFARVQSDWPEMSVRWTADLGRNDVDGSRYVLQWETLPPNRDRPRPEPLPPPSMLRVLEVPTADSPRSFLH